MPRKTIKKLVEKEVKKHTLKSTKQETKAKQTITEYVGEGHPDRVADKIAKIINDFATTSATEVIINRAGLYLSGETSFANKQEWKKAKLEIRKLLDQIAFDYGFKKKVKIINKFISQDTMLAERKVNKLAGDQEVVFYTKLNDNDPHQILRNIDEKVSSITKTFDYKTLVNTRNKTMNLSINTSHKNYEEVRRLIVGELFKHFEGFDLNVCGFVGGSIYNDTGVTGRKLIVEQSGAGYPHGGGACVDGETEFLSPIGWVKIKDFKQHQVAQWNDGKLEFVTPLNYINIKGEWPAIKFNTESLDMLLTEDHDVLYQTAKFNLNKIKAIDVYNNFHNSTGFRGGIPLYWIYDGGKGIDLTDEQIRVQVAFSADGTILNDDKGKIRIKKPFKIERLKSLLNEANIPFTEKVEEGNFHSFFFVPPILEKTFTSEWYSVNRHQVSVIANEITKWDGDRDLTYRTTIKENADFVQYIFMTNFQLSTSIYIDDRIGQEKFHSNGKKYEIKSITYSVSVKGVRHAGLRTKKKENMVVEKTFIDNKYCFEVPSHNLILRRNNKIFITGNCYGKDVTKTAPYGHKLAREYAEKHNVNEVVVAYFPGDDLNSPNYIGKN